MSNAQAQLAAPGAAAHAGAGLRQLPKEDTVSSWCTMFGFRGIDPQELHCTHKYLGDLDDESAASALRTIQNWFEHTQPQPHQFKVPFSKPSLFGGRFGRPKERVLEIDDPSALKQFSSLRGQLDKIAPDRWSEYRPHVTTPDLDLVHEPIDRYIVMYNDSPIWVRQLPHAALGYHVAAFADCIARGVEIVRRHTPRVPNQRVLYVFINGKLYLGSPHTGVRYHADWLNSDSRFRRMAPGTTAHAGRMLIESDGSAIVNLGGPLQRFRRRLFEVAQDAGADDIMPDRHTPPTRFVKEDSGQWHYTERGFGKVAAGGMR